MNTRKPTKSEIEQYIKIVKATGGPSSESGLYRLVAKFFHCTAKDIRLALK